MSASRNRSVVRVTGIVPVARNGSGFAHRRANSSVTAVICARTAIFAEHDADTRRAPKMGKHWNLCRTPP